MTSKGSSIGLAGALIVLATATTLGSGTAVSSAARASDPSCVAPADAYSNAVLADDPVAFYRLDEASGTTMCDSSSSGNNGTYSSTGLTYGVTGPLVDGDTAISAAGATDTLGQSNSDPSGLTGNHAYTLEAWFRNDEPSAPYTNSWLVGIGGDGSTGQAAVLSLDPNHNSQLSWGPASSFGIDQYGADWAWDPTSASVNLWDGHWHYIAVTYTPSVSASASDYVGYVDGHDVGSPEARPYGNSVPDIAASPIIVGNGSNGGYWPDFDGGLSNVAVYGTALSTARIDAHYAAASDLLLSVTKIGTGAGTVKSSPSGIDCGSTCSAGFAPAASVTLTATPSAGSKFEGWSGGGCSGSGKCMVTLNAAASVSADFAHHPPVECHVPTIVGKTLNKAKSLLAKAHCSLGKVTKVFSAKKSGTVVAQSPAAGRTLARHAAVRATVSKGKKR